MKTHTLIITVFASLFTLAAHAQRPAVTGHIEGLGNDSLKVEILQFTPTSSSFGARPIDLWICAKDGKFTLDSTDEYPAQVAIIPKSLMEPCPGRRPYCMGTRTIRIMINPGENVEVDGIICNDKTVDYELTGTDLNRDISLLRRQMLPLDVKADSISLFMEKNGFSQDLADQCLKLKNENRKYQYEYIDNNPDTECAGLMTALLPPDDVEVYYAKLGETAKSGFAEILLTIVLGNIKEDHEIKAAKERMVAGADAPRFTLKSSDGGQVSLTDVKDKYIVLDFWGSWCGPCMMGVPRMKKCYDHYKDKVEFIGIACNDTERKWLETVEAEELPWISVIENPKDKISVEYAIEAFPTKIILDRDYRIVEMFRGEGDDFYKKLDELLK